jgi:hypothetical protein
VRLSIRIEDSGTSWPISIRYSRTDDDPENLTATYRMVIGL